MSHHFSCYTALSLLASKCFFHVSCHAFRLALCDLGDPGWGDASLTRQYGNVIFVSVFRFVCFAIPILELIQCYHLFLVFELDRRSLSSLCFWCLFFVWLCFCVFCCFGCFLVVGCVFVWNRDGCWTMYRSHTSSLLCHLPMAAICMHQLVNLPVLCNMQSNVLNDLAKAKRCWTEKKGAGERAKFEKL